VKSNLLGISTPCSLALAACSIVACRAFLSSSVSGIVTELLVCDQLLRSIGVFASFAYCTDCYVTLLGCITVPNIWEVISPHWLCLGVLKLAFYTPKVIRFRSNCKLCRVALNFLVPKLLWLTKIYCTYPNTVAGWVEAVFLDLIAVLGWLWWTGLVALSKIQDGGRCLLLSLTVSLRIFFFFWSILEGSKLFLPVPWPL